MSPIRELKVNEAQAALTATLKWREEVKINEIMAEKSPEEIFGGAGRTFGKDKQGRPVTYVPSFFDSHGYLSDIRM